MLLDGVMVVVVLIGLVVVVTEVLENDVGNVVADEATLVVTSPVVVVVPDDVCVVNCGVDVCGNGEGVVKVVVDSCDKLVGKMASVTATKPGFEEFALVVLCD